MAIEWIVIGIFILIGLIYIKIEHQTKKVKIVVMILIGFLIYFSIVGLFTPERVDLTSPRGVVNAVYIYFGWIGQTASSLWDIGVDTTHMVGNAIKINSTVEDKQK